jgi:hypothetical protein
MSSKFPIKVCIEFAINISVINNANHSWNSPISPEKVLPEKTAHHKPIDRTFRGITEVDFYNIISSGKLKAFP